MNRLLPSCLALAALSSLTAAAQDRAIRVPRDPRVSPDGKLVAFAWRGDVWLAPIAGGASVRVTTNAADDGDPRFSPDGNVIAFTSDRSGGSQVWVVPTAGGEPKQVTFDSNQKGLVGFTPKGDELLLALATDRGFTRTESMRVFAYDVAGKKPKRMLLDVGMTSAALAPSGDKLLFTRGGASWWRKGYSGSQAAQLWVADLAASPPALTRLDADRPHFQNVARMFPMWAPDSQRCYFVSDPDGTFDLYEQAVDPKSVPRRLTEVGKGDGSDDGVAFPSISADGKTIVFRRRFDLARLDVASGAVTPIPLFATGDEAADGIERQTESSANAVAFTDDGKQIAFVAGEDVWVMDRILREPVRVTSTPHQESSLAFSKDGKRLYFVSDAGGEVDIWEATHAQKDNVWWLAKEFTLRQVTSDALVERELRGSPNGDHIAYVKGADLFVMDQDGSDHRRVVAAWAPPSYDWSPDGKWLVYATEDSDYNSDVFVVPLDGTREPFNLSKHPDRDSFPVWSGDGTRIAWVGRRTTEETDIHYVTLTKGEEEKTERDRKLEEAIAAMSKKGAPRGASGDRPGGARRGGRRPRSDEPPEPGAAPATTPADEPKAEEPEAEKKPVVVTIDFEGIEDRMHRISVADSSESGLVWSPDGKKLAFNATVSGERAFYQVEFPKLGTPTKLAASGLSSARWLQSTDEIVGLSGARATEENEPATPPAPPVAPAPRSRGRGFGLGGGSPAAMSARGNLESFGFSVRAARDWHAVRAISFDQGWRAMRDRFYDEEMNHRDWQAVRAKYRDVAAQCLGAEEFSELMDMMLGELNASHMGHDGGAQPYAAGANDGWSPTTFHLGLRFDKASAGPGLVVASVIPGSPCDQARSRVAAGDTLLSIDGTRIGPDVDVDRVLTLDDVRDLELEVKDRTGASRTVTVRPVRSVAGLLYEEWVTNTRKQVDELSHGKLGYLHIQGMDMRSFEQMEEDLFAAGHGKDGLIIDVRWNGGGSTTDHVLTALTQPVHSITQSRGSGEGYPQDRKVYASWTKPIVLMCNEHSFSNAEILSHAVKQIGRGRVVGMRTAGGVISTGSQRLLDASSVRMPTRGWYLITTGADMELNGCEPDIAMWNPPGGADLQLEAAVKALGDDVAAADARGRVRIESASSRRGKQAREAAGGAR